MDRVEEARRAHARGWALTPLNGKIPLLPGWQSRPAPVLAEVDAWAKAGNVGLRTGAASGVFVIDLEAGADRSLLGTLPPTPEVATGGGGVHLYFQHPKERLGNSVRKLGPKIDTRGDLGQVVFVGSVHPVTGKVYEWVVDPATTPLAPVPAHLLERLRPKPRKAPAVPVAPPVGQPTAYGAAALKGLVAEVEAAGEGARNDTLNRVAFRAGQLHAGGQIPDVRDTLAGACADPDLSKSAGTVARAWEAGTNNPATKPARPPQAVVGRNGHRTAREASDSKPPGAPPPALNGQAGPPEIRIGPDLQRMNDEAEAALVLTGGFYQHAERMVEVRQLKESGIVWLERPAGMPGIVPASAVRVQEAMSTAARWIKYDGRAKAWVPARPDPLSAQAIHGRSGHGFPPLTCVTETPYLTPNGGCHDTQGYRTDTGIYYSGALSVNIPDKPDAQAAFDVLAEPFCDFTFVAACDLAAAVAAVLTIIQRSMIGGPCPLFAARANTRGTGKGLLCDTIATIATGRHASKVPTTDGEEEWRKRLLSIALDGSPTICIDNVAGSIGSTALAMALTECQIVDRILGESRQVRATLTCVWFSTGNNTTFKGDLGRRVIPMDQESKTANPEERTGFRHGHGHDLLAWCNANRPKLVTAALTILKAHQIAGSPTQSGPLGSFESWDRQIRQAVWFASGIDPCETRLRLRHSGDADEEPLKSLFGTWVETVGVGVVVTVPELLTKSESAGLLKDALGMFCKDTTRPETRAVGRAVAGMVGRIVGGHRLVRESKDSPTGHARYKLVEVT